ncbi:MAG TPA: lipopolysaccharide biosynthesis protein [Devosiaceae bacterium]|jgi:O-antigen/teichoic acid export membrane protein
MSTLHRPFLFSAMDKYVGLIINLATTAVVARLLTPDEIGVFVVGGAIVVLAETLRDFGTSAYIVQQRVLDRDAVRTAFTAMAILSLAIAGTLALLAGPIADFYADQRLVPVVRIAAMGVLLGSFAAPPVALLRRELAFGQLAIINTAGLLANLVASVVFIKLGAGYLSLAFASFAAALTVTLGAVLYHPKFWIFRPSFGHWREVFSFGGFSSATAVLNNFYQVLPQALLGRLAGFESAGLYSRAMTLCQLPDRAIVGAFQPVIFPAFAAEVRAGGDLKGAYLHALALLTAVQWPVLICMALLAEPIVAILLGSQWGTAAPVLRILAIAYMAMTPAPLTYPTLVALGKVKDTTTSSLITLPIGVAAILVAAPFGLMAVALSMLASWPLQVAVSMLFVQHRVGFGWRELLGALWKSVPVCISTGLVPAAVVIHAGFTADLPLTALVVACAGAGIGWLLGLRATHHPLHGELRQAIGLLRSRFTKKRLAAASSH